MRVMLCSPGSPTVSRTITIVINPAWGIPAAPIEAAVAVTLHEIFIEKRFALINVNPLPHGNNVTQC